MAQHHDRAPRVTRREAMRLVAGAAALATLPRSLRAQASQCPGVAGTTLPAFSTPACVRDFASVAMVARSRPT